MLDRRTFASLLPALLASSASLPKLAPTPPRLRASPAAMPWELKDGNIREEMHETTQQVGAPHEAIGIQLDNELWVVREGTVKLSTHG